MLSRRTIPRLTDSILPPVQCLSISRCARQRTVASQCALPPSEPTPNLHVRLDRRHASSTTSSSSTRWKSRQYRDRFARDAKVQGLKSRAAFKLLEIDQRFRLFKPGQTVVDLGYAPGSWSQVAQTKTSPDGRVIGIDVLPVQPPKGVSTIQGNFLSTDVQREVRAYVQDPGRGRVKRGLGRVEEDGDDVLQQEDGEEARGYIDMERHADLDFGHEPPMETTTATSDVVPLESPNPRKLSTRDRDVAQGRVVDVILSDMSAPWDQTTGMWVKSVSNPYHRMMNTSGIPFKDHAGSMDLCLAALTFAYDTLRTGGSFVCKFYQGGEDKALEGKLKKLFEKVVREKPESSRSESKEAYFVALRRKEHPTRNEVFD